ncbi:CNP1-like family protein [Xylophilus sp. ASV27]|uniref:CNP1-like family protein n=1 Tax=Xylophilus sp. ASV27 TaxID=2795129 RepID=UPI0018EBC858|nr:CNP1-like family protein [Xylophilus sp. ASV27]
MRRAESAPSTSSAGLRLRAAALACIAALLLPAGPAAAGLLMDDEQLPPEDAAPAAPEFSTRELIAIPMPPGMGIRIGVDPATIQVGKDGIVRYVAVATNAAGEATSAMYEGIRCSNAQVKLYARHYADGGWRPVAEPAWVSLYETRVRYSLAIAKAGVCQDASANGSASKIIRDLRGSPLYPTP